MTQMNRGRLSLRAPHWHTRAPLGIGTDPTWYTETVKTALSVLHSRDVAITELLPDSGKD